MTNKEIKLELIIALLLLLFAYTGVSKLIDLQAYKDALKLQPFPGWLYSFTTWLPFIEIIVALGLVVKAVRGFALYAYSVLMLAFTVYTGLVAFHFFKQMPCTCGGVISRLSWYQHFLFNISFLAVNCWAIRLHRNQDHLCINKVVSPKPLKE